MAADPAGDLMVHVHPGLNLLLLGRRGRRPAVVPCAASSRTSPHRPHRRGGRLGTPIHTWNRVKEAAEWRRPSTDPSGQRGTGSQRQARAGAQQTRVAVAESAAASPEIPDDGAARELAALEEALLHNGPTGDIDEVERTIEAGCDE